MNKRDGRGLCHNMLEEIRIRAVQRVEAGESPEDVIRVLGFGRTVIYESQLRFEFALWTRGMVRTLIRDNVECA